MPPPPCPHFRWSYSQRCRKGTYVDVVMGKNGNGVRQAIQAHRLLCLASLSSEKVVKLLEAGRNFVVRHSVSCTNRKHCCSPYHFSPGTPKDNWADYNAVRQPATCAARCIRSFVPLISTTHMSLRKHLERTSCRQQVKDARKERFRALRLKRKCHGGGRREPLEVCQEAGEVLCLPATRRQSFMTSVSVSSGCCFIIWCAAAPRGMAVFIVLFA